MRTVVAILLILAGCLVLLGVLFERSIRKDPYEPEAAEAPVKQPVVQPVKDPVDEQHDGYQRAQYFTEDVMAAGPSIVAGQDLDDSLLIAELQQAYARYRAGEDVYAGARKELT